MKIKLEKLTPRIPVALNQKSTRFSDRKKELNKKACRTRGE